MTLSYVVEEVGVPFEIKSNAQLHYSTFVVKAGQEIEGYTSQSR